MSVKGNTMKSEQIESAVIGTAQTVVSFCETMNGVQVERLIAHQDVIDEMISQLIETTSRIDNWNESMRGLAALRGPQ